MGTGSDVHLKSGGGIVGGSGSVTTRPSEIYPDLYIGSSEHAKRVDVLEQCAIRHAMNVAQEIDYDTHKVKLQTYVKYCIDDAFNFQLFLFRTYGDPIVLTDQCLFVVRWWT